MSRARRWFALREDRARNPASPWTKPLFRSRRIGALRGVLSEFVDKTPFKGVLDSADLVDVAASVAYHVEEGIRLYPEVIFCTDIRDLSRQAPNSNFIQIGSEANVTAGIKKALKKLAPLTSRDWVIVIETAGGKVRYGVLNPSPSPVSLEFGTALEADPGGDFAVIRVSRLCEDVVRLWAPTAGESLISFSQKEITSKDLAPNAALLASAILAGVEKTPGNASALTYLRRTLEYALQQSPNDN